MNTVILIGRNTKTPETRYSGEKAVCRFTLAINRGKDKSGNDLGADFPSVVCFGHTAEVVERYITDKGRLLGVSGKIKTGSYEDKDGKKVYTTDVVADRVEFLDRAGEGELTPSRGTENKSSTLTPAEDDFVQETLKGFSKLNADDIPF